MPRGRNRRSRKEDTHDGSPGQTAASRKVHAPVRAGMEDARAGAKPRHSHRDLRRRSRDPVQKRQRRRGFATTARLCGRSSRAGWLVGRAPKPGCSSVAMAPLQRCQIVCLHPCQIQLPTISSVSLPSDLSRGCCPVWRIAAATSERRPRPCALLGKKARLSLGTAADVSFPDKDGMANIQGG